jgi:peptide/nickel transport system permease protein
MFGYIVRRLVIAIVLALIIGVGIRLMLYVLPGDPAYLILGAEIAPDPAVIAAIRAELGLDKPIHVQLGNWLYNLIHLNLGNSLRDGRPVFQIIREALPRTLIIVIGGVIFGTLVGIPFGIIAATHRNSYLDWLFVTGATLGISTPVFVIGTLLILVLAVQLRWFPASGYIPFTEDPLAFLIHLTLPVFSLGVMMSAIVTRMTRSTMLEVLNQDYIQTGRAKGARERDIVYRHALRNALIPVVTIVGVELGTMLGRTVLIEYLFAWPGLSTVLLRATRFRDYPVVQGTMLTIAILFILINLITDLVYAWIDPRIRYD